MEKQDVQGWLERYGNAWIDGDPEKIVSLFTEDATYRETPFAETMIGQAAIRQYWQDGASDAQKDVEFASQVWAIEGDIAIAGWQAKFTKKVSGARIELDGTFRLRMRQHSERGLVCEALEEWWHRREI